MILLLFKGFCFTVLIFVNPSIFYFSFKREKLVKIDSKVFVFRLICPNRVAL